MGLFQKLFGRKPKEEFVPQETQRILDLVERAKKERAEELRYRAIKHSETLIAELPQMIKDPRSVGRFGHTILDYPWEKETSGKADELALEVCKILDRHYKIKAELGHAFKDQTCYRTVEVKLW